MADSFIDLPMTSYTFFVPGEPAPKYGDRPRSYTASGAHGWNDSLCLAARRSAAGTVVYGEAVAVEIVFFMPRPQSAPGRSRPDVTPDIDKLERMVLDALTSFLYEDDCQVVHSDTRVFYADHGQATGAAIRVSEVTPDTPQFGIPMWCASPLQVKALDLLPEVNAWA